MEAALSAPKDTASPVSAAITAGLSGVVSAKVSIDTGLILLCSGDLGNLFYGRGHFGNARDTNAAALDGDAFDIGLEHIGVDCHDFVGQFAAACGEAPL
jgi:hypothetical protein